MTPPPLRAEKPFCTTSCDSIHPEPRSMPTPCSSAASAGSTPSPMVDRGFRRREDRDRRHSVPPSPMDPPQATSLIRRRPGPGPVVRPLGPASWGARGCRDLRGWSARASPCTRQIGVQTRPPSGHPGQTSQHRAPSIRSMPETAQTETTLEYPPSPAADIACARTPDALKV